ncbi:MAG: glycosyl hydrolase family 28-related protein, partial [Flavicella sp.]|nr:glycosyl hydrolase family 28-related protein [Flavicella sp.]
MKRRDFIHKTTLMTGFLTVTPHLFHAGNDSLKNNNADYVGDLEKFVLPSDASKIFKVDDYGAKGDGRTDDTPAIQRTMNAAIKKPGSVVLFSAKTYRLTHKTKKFALRLNNGENMIIHGNGATLLISPDTLALDINNCKNVMVRGFIIDYSPLPFMQGTVYDVNAQEGTFTMEVHKGYPIPSDAPFNSKLFGGPQMIDGKVKMNNGKNALGRGWGVIMEPKRRRFKRDVMNACRIRDYDILKSKAGKRRVKLKLHELSAKNIADIEIGDRFVLPLGMHAGGVMHITGGMENTLEDITVYSCPSLTFGAKQTERAVFRGIRVIFKPDSDRLITSCADGFHFRQNRRGSIIEDSLIEGQIDDSINIYCSANSIKKVISPKKYVLNNGTLIQKGDVLEAFEPLKGNSLGRVKVVSISIAKRDYTVELDQPIKGLTASNNRKKGQVFYNRTASGAGYIIRNNTFRYHRRYAMFLKPANGLVEGNKIYGL